MITVETSIEIRRPVEAVFAFVSDFRNNPRWQEAIKEVHVTCIGYVRRVTHNEIADAVG
jgi:uncharacterized membrane protein